MNEYELFFECVDRVKNHGITRVGYMIYSDNGNVEEFNCQGYNFAFNVMRLGKLLSRVCDFR